MTIREEALALPQFTEVSSPVILDKLAQLRAIETRPERFRDLVHILSGLVLCRALDTVQMEKISITTPMGAATAEKMVPRICFIPVLRAGIGMAFGGLQYFPDAQVHCLGMYRNEKTLNPVPYYNKLPPHATADIYVILDIMLATGGSICEAIALVKPYASPVIAASLIAAPEGVLRVTRQHPDVQIYSTALDLCLNDIGYIVPGLGDAGDRYFNTLCE